MDWQGLLKWSLTQTDGTVGKDIQPMDEATKKWLQEAYESYSFDEIKRMQTIVEILMQPEDGSPEDQAKKVDVLDELDDLVTGLDKAKGIQFKIGRLLSHWWNECTSQIHV